jgi:copper(I)-binding protein
VIGKRTAARRVPWALAVGAALLVSACAAGKQAQTVQETPVNDANDANVGTIAIRAVAVKAPTDNFYAKGSSAQMQVVFVNVGSKPDTLTSITSPAFTSWSSVSTNVSQQLSASQGTQRVTVPPGQRVSYGVPDAHAVLKVSGIKEDLWPGSAIKVTFTFQRAGSKLVIVPVQLTPTPGTQAVGGETSSPPGGGAASEPSSAQPSSSVVPASSSP